MDATYISKIISKRNYFNHGRDDSKKYCRRLQHCWSLFFFLIYAGDVLDVGNHEFAVIARFVNKENQIKDEFLTFIVNQC